MSGPTLYLRDYLSPGGRFKYEDLPRHLEKVLECTPEDQTVCLLSVPGFPMLIGWPKQKKPWSACDVGRPKTYKTAEEALRRR